MATRTVKKKEKAKAKATRKPTKPAKVVKSAKPSAKPNKATKKPTASAVVANAWATLRAADDPAARTSLTAFAKLEEVSKLPIWEVRHETGRPLFDGWIADFLAAVDERWLPILHARHVATVKLDANDQRVVFGVVSALCKLLGNLDAVVKLFPKSVRKHFGYERDLEVARGIANLNSPEAIAYLLAEVNPWIEAVNRREYGTTSFEGLLILDRPETHDCIARLLETATYNAHNWHDCLRAAVAAGRFRAQRCLPGLRRAVEQGLGNDSDGTSQQIRDALRAVEAAA